MRSAAPTPGKTSTSATPVHIADGEWLTHLQFRHGGSPELEKAARQGDAAAFIKALTAAYEAECRIGKRERSRLLGSLATLWNPVIHTSEGHVTHGAFAQCLLDRDLNAEEISSRVEAILANTESVPARQTLVEAHWLIRMGGHRFEAPTLFALFRWTMDQTLVWLEQVADQDAPKSDPEKACGAFDFLELQVLHVLILPGSKRSKRLLQKSIRDWRFALDAMTDTDGTPHARWLDRIISRSCQLAATTLFADSLNATLWDKKSHRRQEGLLARIALLISPERIAFHQGTPVGPACAALLAFAEVLHLAGKPGILSLLAAWEKQAIRPRMNSPRPKTSVHGKLPKVSLQSDWAEWGCLRTNWSGPVDSFAVRYSGAIPQMESVVENLPLFAGEWAHELKIDGKVVPATGDWTCCCWYLDRQAAFIELQLDREGPVQVIRQALLLREESLLMLADSIRLPEPGRMEFRRSIPIVAGWTLEEDTLSRELALQQNDTRVRVFPWTGPQMYVHRSDETISLNERTMQVTAQGEGRGLYVGTLFDWSRKRREEPVDWQRVTVAEDGQILSPEIAVGYRLRIGKKQWMLYHSHRQPVFPRSVLGLHTLSESVFARLTSQGEVDALVEVEL